MTIEEETEAFTRDGLIVLRGVFDRGEMQAVRDAVSGSAELREKMIEARSKEAFQTISVWNDTAGDNVLSKVTRSARLLGRIEAYLHDRAYVYHNKLTMKLPGVCGFPMHQDYAYWYSMGCLWPDMATAFVAIDPATPANGCLRLFRGSHQLGRVDHIGFTGVEPKRLKVIAERHEEVVAELDPGDAVIFHCCTFHGSDNNTSTAPRLALLGCYNTKHNDPFEQACGHPNWSEQEKVYTRIEPGTLPRW